MMQPAPLTGTATLYRCCQSTPSPAMQPAPLTGTATIHPNVVTGGCKMQPVPLTGTTTKYGVYHRLISFADAARAPHGDEKRETRNSSVSCLPFYISACSLTSLFHIDEEGYAVIHSPCAAGFRCVLRGRRQLVYILSLYLSYVK